MRLDILYSAFFYLRKRHIKQGLIFKMVALSICAGGADTLLWIAISLLGILININEVLSFNLDSSVPIIKTSGSQSAYFGFSVAQHYISEENPTGHV